MPKLKILSTGPDDGSGVLNFTKVDLTKGNQCNIAKSVSVEAR